MSACEFLIDKGRRIEAGVIHEPCGRAAVVHVRSTGGFTFHWCELHDTAAKREAERAVEQRLLAGRGADTDAPQTGPQERAEATGSSTAHPAP